MGDLKLCKDCRWAEPPSGMSVYDVWSCTHPSNYKPTVSLVTGEKIEKFEVKNCVAQRVQFIFCTTPAWFCGSIGRNWEKKDGE